MFVCFDHFTRYAKPTKLYNNMYNEELQPLVEEWLTYQNHNVL